MSTELTTDERVRQLQKVLSIGSLVIEENDDPDDPDQIGVIVKPTKDELAVGKRELCSFTDVRDEYLMVAWSWSDTPNEVIERRWEFITDLQLARP